MDQEHLLELSRRIEVLHLGGTRLDVIPELKRDWHMRKPSKRSDLREQSTKVVKQLLVGTMLEKRLVSLPSSNRESSRILLLHKYVYVQLGFNDHQPHVPAPPFILPLILLVTQPP
jgi:hypothetical protein